MNGLDLFSGIGGIGLALEPWVKTVAYCERDRYAQGVLLSRMAAGELDRAPIWDDVTSLRASMLPSIDIIFGGFPCQDISVAGRGAGLAGERSGLFFEVLRLAEELSPVFIFLENVPAIRTRGLGRVVYELARLGYDCRWTVVSAASVGAPHLRKRWFLLAHSRSQQLRDKQGWRSRPSRDGQAIPGNDGSAQSLADTSSVGRRKGWSESARLEGPASEPFSPGWWVAEPAVGRVANGLPNRVDRIKCLGNSVVPLQARIAFQKLIGF